MSEGMNEPADWLYFNQATVPCHAGLTLGQLLSSMGVEGQGVTTAVNGCFVPRSQRAGMELAPGDRVLTFQPIVGG
jgi:sulfur carrier protein